MSQAPQMGIPPIQGIYDDSQEIHKKVNEELKEEAAGTGATLHTFHPDAAPETKRQEALNKAGVEMPNIRSMIPGKEAPPPLTTDIGSSDNQAVADALTNPNTVTETPTRLVSNTDTKEGPTTPGAFKSGPAKGLPDWYKVGWTGFSDLPNPGDETIMAEFSKVHTSEEIQELYKGSRGSNGEYNQDVLAQFVNEKYYGEWWFNASVVFISIFFTWLLIKCGLGLMSCFVVGAFFATYYRTSIKRTRRNARDDMQRIVSMNQLETDVESLEWLNCFLQKFWLIFEPVLSAQVIGQVDTLLSENTPSFLDSIRMSSFTLGTKAPRIDGVKSYPKTSPDVVCMDWEVSFVPNDVLDLTEREAQAKVNPKIVLTVRVGKGFVGAGMPILLEDVMFSGKMRIKLKLFNEMPHVKTVELSFLEKPHFDYVLKPVGGDTFGFDINNIPGLESFIKDQVHSNLGPMMYAPNVFTLDIPSLMGGAVDSDAANGVLAVTVYSATGLKPVDLFGTLDPYCTFHVNDTKNPELARTSVVENNSNPKWNETHFVLLNNLQDLLCFNILDCNDGRSDSEVGVSTLNLKEVEENNGAIEGLTLPIVRSGKTVGEIKADVRYFPVSVPETKEDGTVVPAAESNSGVVRFYVLDCKDLGGVESPSKKKSLLGSVVSSVPLVGSGSGDIDAYAVAKANGQIKLTTSTFKRSKNPRWNKFYEVFVTDKTKFNFDIVIKNSTDFSDDPVLGHWSSSLVNMEKEIYEKKNDWWNLQEGSGKIHLNMTWRPILLTGFAAGLNRGSFIPPIGVVRIHIISGKKLKNVDRLGGKSDPYVRAMSGLQPRAQTEFVMDDLDPQWDEVLYVPVHSMREDLLLEVMDWNSDGKMKLIGMTDLFLKDLIREEKKGNDQSIYNGLPAVSRSAEIVDKDRRGGRGVLNYEAQFFATLALAKKKTKETDAASNKSGEKEEKKDGAATEESDKKAESSPISSPVGLQEQDSLSEEEETPLTDLHGETILYTADNQIDYNAYEAGVISVTIHQVTLPSRGKAVAEILVDSNDPQFRTSEVKGVSLNFNESGDAFVKEMDFSRLVVRVLNAKDDDRIGYWSSSVRDIVKSILENPEKPEGEEKEESGREYNLLGCTGGKIRLSFSFFPVIKFTLDPSESLENQGNLTVAALDAKNLKAHDRNGTSDPYLVFSLDGEKVFKSQTYKKQLSPIFKNEIFTAPVVNRKKSTLSVQVYDWDQIGSHDILGETKVPIDELESFAAQEIELPVDQEGGTIHLRLKWEPQLLARKRMATSLLGSTTRILSTPTNLATDVVGMGVGAGGKVFNTGTKVVGMGVGAGGKVLNTGTNFVGGVVGGGVGAIGGGISAIGSGIRGIGRRDKGSDGLRSTSSRTPSPPQTMNMQQAYPVSGVAEPQQPLDSPENPLDKPKTAFDEKDKNATIKVTILGAKDIKSSHETYCRVRLGKHTIHKTKKSTENQWNDTFTTKVFGSSMIEFSIREHRTLADSEVGELNFTPSEYVDEGRPFEGWLPLEPAGSGEIGLSVEVLNGLT